MAELGNLGSLLAESTGEEETKTEITVDMLDFGYVEDCGDVKVLRGILDKLQSGQEGIYPEVRGYTLLDMRVI